MQYVYHRVPSNMTGTMLYPLNTLKKQYPKIFFEHAKKYVGREQLMNFRIPLLGDCLWNDVLFLTAVHPADLRKEYEAAGHLIKGLYRAYQFEIDVFDSSMIAVMTKMRMNEPKVFEHYDRRNYSSYSTVPPETKEYWQETYENRTRPFVYFHIPHILYRGEIDTRKGKVIEV